MKKLLILPLLFFSISAAGQVPEPFKGANVIVIHTQDSAHVALRKMALLMQDAGYMIDRLDKELGSVATKPKALSNTGFTLSAFANVKNPGNSIIYLSGEWAAQGSIYSGASTGTAVFKGMEIAIYKTSFRALMELASRYTKAKISYQTR